MNFAPSRRRSTRAAFDRAPVVVLAEDDDDLRALFAQTLREAGFDVLTAADGLTVLALLASTTPDALVMDVRMPKRSGLDVLRAVRSGGHGMPVVLMTGHGDVPLRAAASNLGATVVLEKPVSREDLVGMVELVVGLPPDVAQH